MSMRSTFSAIDLAPLVWYDPSDITTLWQDAARTSRVTASGQTVGCIDDKSGNGHHMMQATAAKRPIYTESSGLRFLSMDGVDDEMGMAGNTATLSATHEITAAARWDIATANWAGALLSYSNVATRASQVEMAVRNTTITLRSIYNGFDTGTAGASIAKNTDQVYAQNRTAVDRLDHFVNGVNSYTYNTAGFPAIVTPQAYRVGPHVTSTQNFSGRWYGAIVTPVLTAPQRAALTTWIGAKAGLTL
jgi:hypothetical protein